MRDADNKAKGNIFAEYLRTFAKHKFLIIIPLILVFMGAAIFGSSLPKTYKATALFRILRPPSSTLTQRRTSSEGDLEVMRQLILSRSNLVGVIGDVGLDAPYSSLPEAQKEVEESKLVAETGRNLEVQLKANNVFEVSHRSDNPETAARVANAVVSKYIDAVVKDERESMAATITFLGKKVKEYQDAVKDSSEALQKFKAKHILDLPGSVLSNSAELRNLRDQLTAAETQLSDADTAKKEIEKQIREVDTMVVGETVVEANPLIARYNSQLDRLELELSTLKTRFTDLHPDVVRKKSEIESLKSLIAKAAEKVTTKETREANPLYVSLQQELKNAQVRIASAQRRKERVLAKITDCEKLVQGAPALEREMAELTEDDTLNRSLLDHYTTELERAKIEQEKEKDQNATRFQMLDYARKSSATASSNRLKVSLLGLLLGGGLGLGLAVLREQTDTSFKDVEDAASFLDIPVLGTIPTINTAVEKAREKKKEVLGWIIVGSLTVLLGAVLALTSLNSFPGG